MLAIQCFLLFVLLSEVVVFGRKKLSHFLLSALYGNITFSVPGVAS